MNFTYGVVLETVNISDNYDQIFEQIRVLSIINRELIDKFIVIFNNDVPGNIIHRLSTMFNWLEVRIVKEKSLNYYEMKLWAIQFLDSDYLIFIDSDCTYPSDYFNNGINIIEKTPDIEILSGESTIKIKNPLHVSLLMGDFFRLPSNKSKPYIADRYIFNCLFIRKKIFEKYQSELPLTGYFRLQCLAHSIKIRNSGLNIYKTNKLLAFHTPPETPKEIFHQFWNMGVDTFRMVKLRNSNYFIDKSNQNSLDKTYYSYVDINFNSKLGHIKNLLSHSTLTAKQVIKKDKSKLFFLPIAIIITQILFLIKLGGYLSKSYYHGKRPIK